MTIRKVIILSFLAALVSCATTVDFPISDIAPAAEGSASIKQDRNDNYEIEVNVRHLTNASRLNPPKSHYIVWIRDETGSVHNIGRLVPDRRNRASLEAVTPHRPVEIMVTAEDEDNISWPGNLVLFRAEELNLN
jgi:phosphopantothenoylcysteine synthetase/decarboxylase